MVRRVCLEEVVTIFDVSFAQATKGRSQGTHSIEKGASICTMVEHNSTVTRRVMGSTLAAESAALANAVGRQLYVKLLVEALLKDPRWPRWADPNLESRGSWRLMPSDCVVICRKQVRFPRSVTSSW